MVDRADPGSEREAGAIAPVTYSFAARGRRHVGPSASRDAIALASVQPVPWVCRLSSRGDR